jgi:tetratricopeptide (TPR) repeat protein
MEQTDQALAIISPIPLEVVQPTKQEKISETQPPLPALNQEEVLKLGLAIDVHVQKGHQRASELKFEEARKEYRTAVALDPRSEAAILGLGFVSFMQQKWDLALDYYKEVLTFNPSSADAHYGVGRVFLELNHLTEAVSEFRKTLELDPTFYEARETLTALGVVV